MMSVPHMGFFWMRARIMVSRLSFTIFLREVSDSLVLSNESPERTVRSVVVS